MAGSLITAASASQNADRVQRQDGGMVFPSGQSLVMESGSSLFLGATELTATGAQLNALAGNIVPVLALAALGNSQGTAAPITAGSGFVHATAADGTVGVRLPAAVAGTVIKIKNSDAANAVLKVYPATGDAINAIAADGAISMAAKTSAEFIALDATTWYTVPLVPS